MEGFVNDELLTEQKERRRFNRVGLAFFAMSLLSFAAALAIQVIYITAVTARTGNPPEAYPGWFTWGVTIMALYGIAAPVTLLVLRFTPAKAPTRRRLSLKSFFFFTMIAFFLMITGSIIGNMINTGISLFTMKDQDSGLGAALSESDLWLSMLYTCVMAPILEELFFRKLLIDRLHGAGDGVVVLMSGLMFGLFHGNLEQFFYAALVGALFAYIYLHTGNIWYTIALHAIVNIFGGLVPLLMQLLAMWVSGAVANATIGSFVGVLISLLPAIPQYAFAITGLVIFCIYVKNLFRQFRRGNLSMGRVTGIAFANVGVILFLVVSGIQILMSIFL